MLDIDELDATTDASLDELEEDVDSSVDELSEETKDELSEVFVDVFIDEVIEAFSDELDEGIFEGLELGLPPPHAAKTPDIIKIRRAGCFMMVTYFLYLSMPDSEKTGVKMKIGTNRMAEAENLFL